MTTTRLWGCESCGRHVPWRRGAPVQHICDAAFTRFWRSGEVANHQAQLPSRAHPEGRDGYEPGDFTAAEIEARFAAARAFSRCHLADADAWRCLRPGYGPQLPLRVTEAVTLCQKPSHCDACGATGFEHVWDPDTGGRWWCKNCDAPAPYTVVMRVVLVERGMEAEDWSFKAPRRVTTDPYDAEVRLVLFGMTDRSAMAAVAQARWPHRPRKQHRARFEGRSWSGAVCPVRR